MNDPLISVITPVYNVEPYIKEFIDSVLNQTYKNLEIICVNDASPDNCSAILDEYASRDPRLIVIHLCENTGCSAATNCGLDRAKGDYITFADPDDWIEFDYYERAVSLAENSHADIVITNFYREYPDRSEIMENAETIPVIFSDKSAAFRYGFEADIFRGFKMFHWNKLFRSRFFAEKELGGMCLRMDQDLITGADVLMVSECFLNANSFAYSHEAFHHYRIRENSAMRSGDFSHRLGLNKALERIADTLEQNAFDESVIGLVKRFHTYFSSQLAEYAYSIGDMKGLEFSKRLINRYLSEYYQTSSQHIDRLKRINRIIGLTL
jgi:glycosyltransferase involved in cell wall biosynthesis